MKVYGITHLLTFNTEDVTRYPDIIVIAPQHVPQTRAWLPPIEKTGQEKP